MATKAQLINFIIEKFQEPSGEAIVKSKLDSFKKAELEEFIKSHNMESELTEWLAQN